jgi:hypothetical protein
MTSQEPNNVKPPEYCAAANWTEAFNNSWGWADTRCTFSMTYICKVIREWPPSLLLVRSLQGGQWEPMLLLAYCAKL